MHMRTSLDCVYVHPINVANYSLIFLCIVYMFILAGYTSTEREYMVQLENEHSHACAMRTFEYIDVCTNCKHIRTVGLISA